MGERYVKQVEHNIKGGGTVELGPRTLIVGPNGVGKSAVVNAVEAALTGKVSDIAGRRLVSSGLELLSLGTGDGAWALATLDDETTAKWTVESRPSGGAKRPVRKGREGVLPLREVLDALTGSADKARRYLLRHACQNVEEADILSKMEPGILARYSRLSDSTLSPVDNLLLINETAQKRSRDASREAKAAAKTRDAAALNLGPAPGQQAVEVSKTAWENAQAVLTEAQRLVLTAEQAAAHHPGDDTTYQEDHLRAAIHEAAAEQQELLAELARLPTPTEAGQALLRVLTLLEEHREEDCFACGSPRPSNWDAHCASVRGSLANSDHAQERATIEAKLTKLASVLGRGQRRLENMESIRAQLQERRIVSPITLDEAMERLEAARVCESLARATWTGHSEAQHAHKAVDIARETARSAVAEAEAWHYLGAVCASLVEELVEGAVATFSSRVQRFLPPTDTFGIRLTTNAVRYGLVKTHEAGHELHTALSGAEWARVSLALAAACTPEDAEVSVLVPEDRSWDPKTLKGVLKGLSGYDGQVIVTTTVKPFRGVPAGWTLLEMGA
jgi:energy-coupling factor transporter ATP-binding protein EcfA2